MNAVIEKQEFSFKIYWKDMDGTKNKLFTKGPTKEIALEKAINHIRNNIYLGSFTIVGLEQFLDKGWSAISIQNMWCKGR
jgi:hypothetical protein